VIFLGSTIKLLSVNVNGIRASIKKGLEEFVTYVDPDVICFQEIRASKKQIDPIFEDYEGFIVPGLLKGHTGVATYVKGEAELLDYWDGRFLQLKYRDLRISNCYVPVGLPSKKKSKKEALHEKLKFFEKMEKYTKMERHILAGDFNIAHTDIDLHYESRGKIQGCTDEEANAINNLGMADSFRLLKPETERFSWWSSRGKSENKGWRIDYIFVSDDLKHRILRADILDNQISDHSATFIELK